MLRPPPRLALPLTPAAAFQPLLSPWPHPRPDDWPAIVNQPLPTHDLDHLRQSLSRNRPFGDSSWTIRTATHLHLSHTLRPPGRPKKLAPINQP